MKVGIDGNEANQAKRVGIGQVAFNVIAQLEKLDKKNKYFVYLSSPPLPDLPRQRDGWQYKVFGPRSFWTQIALPVKLFVQKEQLDIFFTPSHYAPRFSPAPTVIFLMDLWHHRHPEQFAKKDLFQLTKWESYSVKNAKHILTISEFSKSEIINFYHLPPEKITVAYPGFTEDSKVKPNEKDRFAKIKTKYGIKTDYLIYIGTLQPKKNIEGLLRAFSLLIKEYKPSITLVIVGKKGWLYEKIFGLVEELNLADKVIFTGFIDDEEKSILLSEAKAFVFPSFYEGFGIPVLEAMALKTPVVLSKEGSLIEVGGEAASYFDPYKIEDIKRAIKGVLSLNKTERDEIINTGLEQVKKFSWEACARTVLATLEKTVDQNK